MSLPIDLTDKQAVELLKRENFIVERPLHISRSKKCVTVLVVGSNTTRPEPANIFKNADGSYTVRLAHGIGIHSEDMAIAKRARRAQRLTRKLASAVKQFEEPPR